MEVRFMKTIQSFLSVSLVSLASLATVVGCSSQTPGTPGNDPAATSDPKNAVALEAVLGDVDTGHDLEAARTKLEAMLAQGTLSKEDRVRVEVALSKVLAAGTNAADKERSLSLLESAVAAGDDSAEKKLFSMLTGRVQPSAWSRRGLDEPKIAPVARALAKFFPAATPDRNVEVGIIMFGGAGSTGDLGTFAIGDVLRQNAVAACGLCDEVKTSIHTSRSQSGFWTSIPRYASKLETSLVVVYVDEETMVPERYAKWLAAPLADIRSALDRREGLVAVKERAGAPPLVTLVAPRPAFFATVEGKLAAMTELPKQPVTVKIDRGLDRSEIQRAIRDRYAAMKGCYETLLKQRPTAAGKISMAFSVDGQGTLGDLDVGLDGTIEEPAMRSCVIDVAQHLRFPKWSNDPSAKTTVRYPIEVHP
jgi:hypothetical protein